MATIYVYLLNEGTPCWRPVEAVTVEGDTYRILSTNADSEDEEWEFNTGDLVRCEHKSFSGGEEGLVAVERLPAAS